MKKRAKFNGQNDKLYLKKLYEVQKFPLPNNNLAQQFHFPTFSKMLRNRLRGQKISEIIENLLILLIK